MTKTIKQLQGQSMQYLKIHSLLSIKQLIFTGFLLTLTAQGFAQEMRIQGYITDSLTNNPIVGAIIKTGNKKVKAITNSSGYYSLKINGATKLIISYIGYKTKNIKINSKEPEQTINISLSENDITIGEVVVTSRDETRKLKESALPVSIINNRQLQGTASSINDVLARTVGVTVRNTGGMGSASRITVRGLEGKRMGIFVDDISLGQVGNFVALNDIPTSMIQRIEVYKGLVPYKFGGSALGGAVNVVTKEYPPFYLDASYEIASFNTHQLSSVAKRSLSKQGLEFGLGGVFSYSDNDYKMRLANIDNRRVRRDHDMFRKLIAGGSIKATKWWFDEIKTEFIYNNTKNEIQGIDIPVKEAYNYSKSFLVGLTLKRKNFFIEGLDLDFNGGLNWGKFGLIDKATRRYDWDGNVYSTISPLGGEQSQLPSDDNNHSFDALFKLNLGYTLDTHHSFNLNVYGSHTAQDPEDLLMDKALGYQANFHSEMNSLTTGLSYDLTLFKGRLHNAFTLKNFFYNSKSQAIDEYSVKSPEPVKVNKNYWGFNDGIRYTINKHLMLKGSFNSEVRIPTNEELIGNAYSILPSPALKPERTTGTNLGVLYNNNKPSSTFEIELNAFYNIIHETVRLTQDMIPTMLRYRNFGNIRTKGIELEVKGDITHYLYGYANATYQDLRDARKTLPGTTTDNPTYGKRIPNVPYQLANLGLEYHKENLFGGHKQQTHFFLDASYIHQYYYDFEVSRYQDRKIPTSFTMDAAIEHSFQNKKWTITLKVKNLLNREVYSELNKPLPTRNLALKVRYVIF